MIRGSRDPKVVIGRDSEGSPSGRVIFLSICGRGDLEPELGMNVGGHVEEGKEKEKEEELIGCEKLLKVKKG